MALFIDKLIHSLHGHTSGTSPQKSHKKHVKLSHHHTKNHHHHQKDPQQHKKKKHHHSSPKRSHCAKVKLDRVLADRKVCCSTDFGPCDIGFAVPPCSILSGTINVTVLECDPVICDLKEPVTLDILLFIEQEFTVTLPDGTKIPLEFSFHHKCIRGIPPIKAECLDPKRIRCQIFNLQEIKSKIKFICEDRDFDCHATIAVHLDVIIALNLVTEEQLCVALCSKHNHQQNRSAEENPAFPEEQEAFADEENNPVRGESGDH